jgi:hypothetical protein
MTPSDATNNVKAEMIRQVQERVRGLRSMSHADLKALPATATESVQILGKTVALTVYRDNHPNDELLIAVQAFRDRPLGSASIHVEGFVCSSSGEKSNAAEELLWDFL